MVNILTLGHKGLYSDLSYFWLLQNLIKDKYTVKDPVLMSRQIRSVIRHRPNIESLYTLSCFVMTIDYHLPKECDEIAREGMNALPKSWMIPAVVGYVYAFVLKDMGKASYYYQKTRGIPRSPEYLSKLSDRLLKGILDKKDGEDALHAIIEGADDPDYRDFLIKFLNTRK